jgi:hypothetical protein
LLSRCKKQLKIRDKGHRPRTKKEFFTSDDYQNWILTRLRQAKYADCSNKNLSLKNQISIELATLERQKDDPAAAYEARKTNL